MHFNYFLLTLYLEIFNMQIKIFIHFFTFFAYPNSELTIRTFSSNPSNFGLTTSEARLTDK